MLNALFRCAARLARARSLGLATCAWMAWMPAHAAEAPAAEQQTAATPFNRYQGWRDEPLQDWRQANERVGEVGGWRTYLRESQPAGDAAGQGRHGHQGMEEAP